MRGNFRDQPRVLITGGSRGLGLALARQYAMRGAHVILCARSHQELERARQLLSSISKELTVYSCDQTDSAQVNELVGKIRTRFGGIDFLVNNAGIIEVGPLSTLQLSDFEKVVDTNLFGMIRMTLAMIPLMKKGGHVVNITSIGGAVAVPHMITYTVSKFGALGFSLGLDAELAERGIAVTTVLPGLMRTGSFVHAFFRGNAQKEFNWFSLSDSLPLISMSADRAANKIVRASQQRKRFIVLGTPARFLRLFYLLFPPLSLMLMRGVVRLMPRAAPESHRADSVEGKSLKQQPFLQRRPRKRFNQMTS